MFKNIQYYTGCSRIQGLLYTGFLRIYMFIQGVQEYTVLYIMIQNIQFYTGCSIIYRFVQYVPEYIVLNRVFQNMAFYIKGFNECFAS